MTRNSSTLDDLEGQYCNRLKLRHYGAIQMYYYLLLLYAVARLP